jgi:hypothetical protein
VDFFRTASAGLRRVVMEEFIHLENLALYERRLAEPHTDAQHEILLRLQAEEVAKELPPESDAYRFP